MIGEPLYELYPVGRPAQTTEPGAVIAGVDYTGAPEWAAGLTNESFEAYQPPLLSDEVATAARVLGSVTAPGFESESTAQIAPTFLARIRAWFGGAA